MSQVNRELVKIFFEMNGFLLKMNEQILIQNLKPKSEEDSPPPFLLTSTDLPVIDQAVIDIKGWHTDRFLPSRLRRSQEIFDFVQPESLKKLRKAFGGNKFKKILILSSLSAKKDIRNKSIKFLQSRGIDHVLEFDSILSYLIRKVRPNRNYVDSDLLQLLRLLKNYHLLKDPQLELFK